jgi:hypothetical protein
MARWAAFLSIFIAPYLVLRLPGVPQTLGRTIAVSILLIGGPVAIFWFGLKSQISRPGAKLYQPQFDSVRPRIEWAIRILVLPFGAFFLFVLTLPLGEDLFLLAVGQKPLRITKRVKYTRSDRPGNPRESIGLSDEDKSYQLYYPTKALRLGDTYEFVVLPRSRMILDYRESNK